MRITNTMMVNTLNRNIFGNLTRMDTLQNQLATGRQFANISDDPLALIYSQSARNTINRINNFARSVHTAQDWLTQAEDGIMEMQRTMVDLYELAVQASNDTKGTGDESDKRNIAPAVRQLTQNVVDTLNSTFGNRFLFGGFNTPGDRPANYPDEHLRPFTVADCPDAGVPALFLNGRSLHALEGMTWQDFQTALAPPGGEFSGLIDVKTLDVGPGIEMPISVNGIELAFFRTPDPDNPGGFIMRSVWSVANDLYEKTSRGAPAYEVMQSIRPLQDAQNHLLTETADIGGRIRRLELLEARYEQNAINFERMRSNAEDVDFAETIMHFRMAEAVYQAALSAGARIIQPTLMDFLR
ncbi:MAG: hypothetical protein FWB97_02180 [Oscillospiraceae bacterium]|nr:hypothetical protein [Oscillospiraceae bacterium]